MRPAMTEPAIELDSLADVPREQIGAKAANLGRLIAAGLPVPPGLVIPAAAAGASVEEQRALLARVRELAADLGERLAVRSSALLEDRAMAAAPGVFESVLEVRPEGLEAAVRAVWAAASAPLTRAYARAHGVEDVPVAVIVQQDRKSVV